VEKILAFNGINILLCSKTITLYSTRASSFLSFFLNFFFLKLLPIIARQIISYFRVYQAHPWLTDSEREQICRLMNCQKLSLEASTHAAQNERLPLRVIVQVLFFEQLRLRTSVAGWVFVSDNLENSQNPSGNLALARNGVSTQAGTTGNHLVAVDDMKERVSELEKECFSMKQEIEKLVKTKGGWNAILKRFTFKLKSKPCDPKASKPGASPASPLVNGGENHDNGELGD